MGSCLESQLNKEDCLKIRKNNLIIAVGLSFVLSIATFLPVSAENVPTTEQKVAFLKSIGTTDEAISIYNPTQINNLYNDLYGKDVHFSGFETKDVKMTENVGDGKARGNISTSMLRLTVATYDFVANGKVTGMNVSLGYQWLQSPILHHHDALTFTWDNNLFYDAGFYAESGYNIKSGFLSIDRVNAPATAQAGGMGWYLNTALPPGITTSNNFGGADIYLKAHSSYSPSTRLNSKMYFTYAHQILGLGITLGFPGSVGVSITGGNYDQQTYSYTYH